MIAIERDIAKGSLRSIHEFPLLDLLKDCSDLLLNFGGHDFAAGMTLKQENIEKFKTRFLKAANERLSTHDVLPKLMLDAEVKFDELTFDLMESIKLWSPSEMKTHHRFSIQRLSKPGPLRSSVKRILNFT